MENEEDITDKTALKWGGGYIAAELKCKCGLELTAFTQGNTKCPCGQQYWIACRVMTSPTSKDEKHDCECDCSPCNLARAKYQTDFEDKHDH